MADIFHFTAESRNERGTSAARRLRQQDKVPAVIYGAGKDPQKIHLDHNQIRNALFHAAVYSHILTIAVDGQEEKVVLKEITRHPAKPRVLHIDFQRVSATEKLTRDVPIHFFGEQDAPGVKAGGIISKLMAEIEIKCLPAYLPERIDIDLSRLELNAVIHLSDVKLPQGVELSTPAHGEQDQPVVTIYVPRAEKEEVAAPVSPEVPTAAEVAAATKTEEKTEKPGGKTGG